MSKQRQKVDPIVVVLDIVIVAMVFAMIYVGSSLMFYIDFAERSGTLMQESEMMSFELSNNDYAALIQGKYINEFNGNTESEAYHALANYAEAVSKYKVYAAKGYANRSREQKEIMVESRDRMKDLQIFADRIDKMFGTE